MLLCDNMMELVLSLWINIEDSLKGQITSLFKLSFFILLKKFCMTHQIIKFSEAQFS